MKKKNKLLEFNQFEDISIITDEELFEMTNIVQKRTNLPMGIWISSKMGNHGPRIKAQNDYSQRISKSKLFVVTIEDEPKIIGDTGKLTSKDLLNIVEFVKQNQEPLLDLWNEIDIDIYNIIDRLIK